MGEILKSNGKVCFNCQTTGKIAQKNCVDCLSGSLMTMNGHYCSSCLEPMKNDNKYAVCYNCRTLQSDGMVAITYNQKYTDFSTALHGYKGAKIPKIEWMVVPLQNLVREYLEKHLKCITKSYGKIDAIIPIPGNAERILEDKKYCGIPVHSCLVDDKHSIGFSHGGTREYVPDRFSIAAGKKVPKHVLLFDDVYTTGVTCHSAIECLKQNGAEKVLIFVVARQLWDRHIDMVANNGFDINVCPLC